MLALWQDFLGSLRDLLPIVLVVAFFQLGVVRQPFTGLPTLLVGAAFVVCGLSFFIFGLRVALFPIGEGLAHALAGKGSVFLLVGFAFALGFGTTITEPTLIDVAQIMCLRDIMSASRLSVLAEIGENIRNQKFGC